jgi:hypothetical protein
MTRYDGAALPPAPQAHRVRRPRGALCFLLLALLMAPLAVLATVATPANAGSTVTVRVVVERVDEHGCTDFDTGSDFYGRITIAGQDFDFGRIDGEDTITPNWKAEKAVDVDAASSVPVQIRIAEFDTLLNFGDDECDITSGGDFPVDLNVALVPCGVSGEITGSCGTSLFTSGDDDDSAEINFRVEVDEPGATVGLAVRCTHSPLWPQPGQPVTITVESLDGAVQVGDTMTDNSRVNGPGDTPPKLVDRTKIADSLEIWAGDQTGPKQVATGKTSTTFTTAAQAAGDLVYSCRVKDGTDSAFTGWRRVRVGAPAEGKAVPVIYTGDKKNKIDVVFVPDTDSYTGTGDPAFLTDVSNAIKGAYFGQDYFLRNQGDFNFWLADQTGDADNTPADDNCTLAAPANWGTDYSWKDTGAILHTNRFRDCAGGGVFSSEPDSLGTVLHETGHSPFGLADEYCCDGGYFETPEFPDIYDSKTDCEADAPNLGRVAGDCRTWTSTNKATKDTVWFTSEPDTTDLMNADRRPPQAADVRRMDWKFGLCRDGKC